MLAILSNANGLPGVQSLTARLWLQHDCLTSICLCEVLDSRSAAAAACYKVCNPSTIVSWLRASQQARSPSKTGSDVCVQDETLGFAQITLRIRSRHKFAAYTARGHLAAGSADTAVPVQDFWVFERSLRSKDPVSCWRVAGRLSLPPQEPAQRGILFRAFQRIFARRRR